MIECRIILHDDEHVNAETCHNTGLKSALATTTDLPGLPGKCEAPVDEEVEGRAQLGLEVVALVHHRQPTPPGSRQLHILHDTSSPFQCCCFLPLFLYHGSRVLIFQCCVHY